MTRGALGTALLIAGLTVAMSGNGWANVVLTGPDGSDGSYSRSALTGLAGTASTTVGGATLTGIPLWNLLNAGTGVKTTTPVGDNSKNAILRYYILATDSSGDKSVVSLGEIDPNFGGTGAVPDFIAYQSSGGLTSPELVIPGSPGRSLTDLVSLQLLAAPAASGGGGITTSFTLSGDVSHPGSYDLADLEHDFTETQAASGNVYTGVSLFTLLGAKQKNITDQIVITTGSDGYETVLSLAELDGALGGNPGDFLAYADSNHTDFPGDGVARTVLPNDNKKGRWVSNLDEIEVLSAPEPASLPSFAGALLAFGLVLSARRLGRA